VTWCFCSTKARRAYQKPLENYSEYRSVVAKMETTGVDLGSVIAKMETTGNDGNKYEISYYILDNIKKVEYKATKYQ